MHIMQVIQKLLPADFPEMHRLNRLYEKTEHTEAQKILFAKAQNNDNLSYGIFFGNRLTNYVCAFIINGNVTVESFIFKDSKAYIGLLRVFFYMAEQRKTTAFEMYICDKGLVVMQKYINHNFNNAFVLLGKSQETRFGEELNHIQFRMSTDYRKFNANDKSVYAFAGK